MKTPPETHTTTRIFGIKLLLLSLFMMAPLYGMLALKWPRAHDYILYAGILSEFSSQFWHGQWYPRWLMEVYEGYGSPIFFYYNPLAFFILTPLEFLKSWDPYGLWRVLFGMQIALIVSGITCFRWLRHHFDTPKAQMGSLLYAGFPYFPILIYYNYGVASLWTIAFFPLVLEGIDRLRTDDWRGVPRLVFAFAFVCLSHLLTLITFMLVPISYVLIMAAKGQRFRQFFLVGISGVLAIALCFFYLLPMLLNQPFINSQRFITEVGSYSDHFWMIHSLFGFLCFIPPLLGLYFEQPKNAVHYASKSVVRYWVLIMVALLFIISPASRWLWDVFTPLHFMQFPMRFYTGMWPAAVFLAVLWLPQAKTRGIYAFLLMVMLINVTMNSWDTWFNNSPPADGTKTIVNMNNNPVYNPRWVEEPLPVGIFQSADAEAIIVEGDGEVHLTQWSPTAIKFHATISGESGRVLLHQFYFPYWQSDVGTIEPFHGFLSLSLSKGDHEITLTGGEFLGKHIGNAISAVTLLLLVVWSIISAYKRRETQG